MRSVPENLDDQQNLGASTEERTHLCRQTAILVAEFVDNYAQNYEICCNKRRGPDYRR
jgi:hypothetical protein